MNDQNRVQQSFTRALGDYESHARIQADIATNLITLFKDTCDKRSFESFFEFGCGTGLLTRHLVDFEYKSLVLNDIVPGCNETIDLTLPKRKYHWDFIAGPVEKVALQATFDLIASSSTIQWIPEIKGVLAHLSQSLKPGGWMILSGFGTEHFSEISTIVPEAKRISYYDQADWESLLPSDMIVRRVVQESQKLHFPNTLEILKHLRHTGVNATSSSPWSKRRMASFEEAYQKRFRDEDGLPLTYDPVLIIAQKAT